MIDNEIKAKKNYQITIIITKIVRLINKLWYEVFLKIN